MKYTVVEASNDTEFGLKAKAAFYAAIDGLSMPNVVLPTGETPRPFYQALRDDGSKPAFTYVQLDEYLGLAESDPRLFAAWLARDVLDPLDIKIRLTFNSAAEPEQEVRRMRDRLAVHGPIDIAVLGIGSNGHIGFNEPGSSFDHGVRIVDLAVETIAANKAYWPQSGTSFPAQAFTLGLADLKAARQTILLVRGEGKAEILRRALLGEITPDVPGSYLQRQKGLTIVADTAALSAMKL